MKIFSFYRITSILLSSCILLVINISCTHSQEARDVAGEAGAPSRPNCAYIMRRQLLDSNKVKCKDNAKWNNYGETVFNKSVVYIQPSTEEEVQKIVFIASRNNWKVRPVGSGHSWSQATQADDILMGTHKLVSRPIINKSQQTVTVAAGIRLQDLADQLESKGYTLPNFGSIQRQTLGGAISTNTHGTGLTHKGFAGGVVHLRMVDGRGKLFEASPRKNKNLFYSALSGAGMLGVITQVTVKIVPKFNIYAETQPVSLDQLFFENGSGAWERVARENEWFSILWVLNTDWTTIFSGIKATSQKTKAKKPNKFLESLNRDFFAPIYTSIYVHNKSLLHRFVPPLFRVQRWAQPRQRQYSEQRAAITKSIDPSHWAWNLETEFFFPVEFLPEFVESMKTYSDALKREGIHVAAPMLGFRFVKGDSSYLSPTYKYKGYDEFVALSVFDHNRKSEESEFTDNIKFILQDIVKDKKLLRMHLGKIYKDRPSEFWKRFANWRTFKATRNQYDPKGIFLNQWTKNFFDEWAD